MKVALCVLALNFVQISATEKKETRERSANLVVLPPIVIGYEELYIDNDGPLPPNVKERDMDYDETVKTGKPWDISMNEVSEDLIYTSKKSNHKITETELWTQPITQATTQPTVEVTTKATEATTKATQATTTKSTTKKEITTTKKAKTTTKKAKATTKKAKTKKTKATTKKSKDKTTKKADKKKEKKKKKTRVGGKDVNDFNDLKSENEIYELSMGRSKETHENLYYLDYGPPHNDYYQTDQELSTESANKATKSNNFNNLDEKTVTDNGEEPFFPRRNDGNNPSILLEKISRDGGDGRGVITLKGQGEIGEGKEILDFIGNFRVPKSVLDCPCLKQILQKEKPAGQPTI